MLKRLLSNLQFTPILFGLISFGLVIFGLGAVVPAVTGAHAQAESQAASEPEPEPSQTLPDTAASEDPVADQTAANAGALASDQSDDATQPAESVEATAEPITEAGEDDTANAAPAAPKRPSFTVTDVSMSMTVLKDCNVRAGPFNSEPVIKIAFHDSVVQATGWVQGPNWYRIQLDDGGEGYIHGSLLDETTAADATDTGELAPAAPTYYVPGQSPSASTSGNVSGAVDVPSEEQTVSQTQASGPGGPDGPSNTLPRFPSYALPKLEPEASDGPEGTRDAVAQGDEQPGDNEPQIAALDEAPDEMAPAASVEPGDADDPTSASERDSAAVEAPPAGEDLRQSMETVVTSSIDPSTEAIDTPDEGATDKAATSAETPPGPVQTAANTAPLPALEGREFSPEPRTKPTLGDLAAKSAMRVPDPLAPGANTDADAAEPAGEAAPAVAAIDKTMYISEDAEVHAEPSYSSELITVLHAPNAIKVTGWVEEAGWYQVAMLDGGTGFVSALMLSEEFLIPSMDILQKDDDPAGEATRASAGPQGGAAAGLSGDWYVSHVQILDADYAQPKPAQPTFTGKGDDSKLEIFEAGRLRYSLSVKGDTFMGTEFNYSCGQFTELPVRGSVSEDGILSIEYQMMMDGCNAVPPQGPVVYQLTRF